MESYLLIAKQIYEHHRGIIHPRHSRWFPYWDGSIFASLAFTAIVTPIEVCLFKTTPPVLFAFNRAVDLIFVLDVIFNFFLAYQESVGGRWVTLRADIRRHYLRGWFLVDLISVVPMDLLMHLGVIALTDDGSTLIKLLRVVKLLRLIKLLRILRASRLLARWRSYAGLSFAQMAMIRFFCITFFVVSRARVVPCACRCCCLRLRKARPLITRRARRARRCT